MPGRVVSLNGVLIPEREARISIFDSGLLYGDMAFEMTRTFQQRPFHLREHLQRLDHTLQFLEIDCGLSLEQLEQRTLETLEQNLPTEARDVDWHIRHDISRGPAELYSGVFPEGLRPTVLISCWPLIKHLGRFAKNYETGVNLIVPTQHHLPASLIDPRVKTRSRMHYQLAQLQANRRGAGLWPALTDPDGFLTEGPSWNIFLVKDGTLYTPESRHILNGISRAVTMQVAHELGIPVLEADLRQEEALQADEIFCTATSFGLVHAATFEGRQIGDGSAGAIYHKLFAAWKTVVGLDFVSQARSYAARMLDWEARELAASKSAAGGDESD